MIAGLVLTVVAAALVGWGIVRSRRAIASSISSVRQDYRASAVHPYHNRAREPHLNW